MRAQQASWWSEGGGQLWIFPCTMPQRTMIGLHIESTASIDSHIIPIRFLPRNAACISLFSERSCHRFHGNSVHFRMSSCHRSTTGIELESKLLIGSRWNQASTVS
eukprot:gene24627-biopygen10137